MWICALSGQEVIEPVVSKNGHIFEKSLVQKYLLQNQNCPITNEPLSFEELIPLQINKAVQPRPVGATSVPGLLQILQNEWDAGVLESFQLKKQLDSVRQELAHALYQYDASCRVIARLIKEKDDARKALEDFKVTVASKLSKNESMDVEDTFSEELKQKLTSLSEELIAKRSNRDSSCKSVESISKFKETESFSIHQSSQPGVLSIDIHKKDNNKIITGGVDHSVILFDKYQKRKLSTLSGHSKPVHHVQFHPEQLLIASASQDKTVRIWTNQSYSPNEFDFKSQFSFQHSSEISSLLIHPLDDYFISTTDVQWFFHNLHTGKTLLTVSDDSPTKSQISSAAIHPDCLLLATGQSNGIINMWDIKNNALAVGFGKGFHKGAVNSIQCSENGFNLISASDKDICLWDLRDFQTPVQTVDVSGLNLRKLHLDHSGNYLAAAGSKVVIYNADNLSEVTQLSAHAEAITDVKWDLTSSYLVSTSLDRTMKFYY